MMLEDTPQEVKDAIRRIAKRRTLRQACVKQSLMHLAQSDIIHSMTEGVLDDMLRLIDADKYFTQT